MKAINRNIYLIAAVVVVAAILVFMYFINMEHPDLLEKEADYIMTAGELYSEFEADEAAAGEKYIGKIIQVSGTVSFVDTERDSSATVSLMGENDFAGVLCSFTDPSEKVVELKNGEKACIKGICSGMLMDVQMSNCVLLETQ